MMFPDSMGANDEGSEAGSPLQILVCHGAFRSSTRAMFLSVAQHRDGVSAHRCWVPHPKVSPSLPPPDNVPGSTRH